MTRPHHLLLAAAALVSLTGAAYAGATSGDYKFTVGRSAPCGLTLAESGSATPATTCEHGENILRWKATHSDLLLQDGAGAVVALLKPGKDGYAGQSLVDGHTIVVTPISQTATAATH